MQNANIQRFMLRRVAQALGPKLLTEVAFVGGCTTALFLTDEFSRDQVRHTEDVDLIVHVAGKIAWPKLQEQLRRQGFKDDMWNDAPICAMKLDGLRVDFMPDDPDVLGFSNRWYREALATAFEYQLDDDTVIRLVRPEYFVATKLEAFLGRGNNDPMGSTDIEDLLNLFDGRPAIVEELSHIQADLLRYIGQQLSNLAKKSSFATAIEGTAHGDQAREALIFERIESIIRLAR